MYKQAVASIIYFKIVLQNKFNSVSAVSIKHNKTWQ